MDLERWKTISKRDQLGHIAAEILRARGAENVNLFRALLERALTLVDLTLEDPKWKDSTLMLLRLRDEVAKAYESGRVQEAEKVYAVI